MTQVTYAANNVSASFEFEALPEASRLFIINYGIRQYLNDGAAVGKDWTPAEDGTGPKTVQEEKARRVEDRVKKLNEGTVSERASGGGQPKLSVEDRIWRELAIETLRAAAKAQNKKLPKDEAREALIAKVIANPKFVESQKKEHAARVKAAQTKVTVDLNELGLTF